MLRPMASRIRDRLKTLGFCVGPVGAAVGATAFCVGAVGAGGKGYVEYLPLSGPYGPYAKNSGPYSGPYGPYKLPIALFMSVYQCTWVSFSMLSSPEPTPGSAKITLTRLSCCRLVMTEAHRDNGKSINALVV